MDYVRVNENQQDDMSNINESTENMDEMVSASSLDNNQNDMDNSSHPVRLLRAAMPHLNHRTQKSMNMVLKATELMSTIQSFGNDSEVSAMELEDDTIDMEAMLSDMRKVSSGREGEMIDNMLNLMRVRSLYQTYQSLASNTSDGKGQNSNPFGSLMGGNDNVNMLDMLSSFMSAEQKSQLDNISMIMSMMS